MIRRTKAEWLALFEEHSQSNLTATAFCRQKNLCPRYFSLHRRQLSNRLSEVKPAGSPFIKAQVQTKPSANDESITLRCGDSTLTLPLSISPHWLASLVKALA